MFLAVHSPMFGEPNIDAVVIACPSCGKNDWQQQSIAECNPGDVFTCACGKQVIINWGLVEPDHLSNWISSEHCSHHLCQLKYQELRKQKGWQKYDSKTGG